MLKFTKISCKYFTCPILFLDNQEAILEELENEVKKRHCKCIHVFCVDLFSPVFHTPMKHMISKTILWLIFFMNVTIFHSNYKLVAQRQSVYYSGKSFISGFLSFKIIWIFISYSDSINSLTLWTNSIVAFELKSCINQLKILLDPKVAKQWFHHDVPSTSIKATLYLIVVFTGEKLFAFN